MADAIIADVDSSGIYQIRNTQTGRLYIGSAKSFRVRWTKHKNDLRRGRHHSAYLQRSWNRRGEEAFAFEVIEACEASYLLVREQAWLDALRPAYNISPTAGNCLGVKHSAATKLKHTLAMKGRKFPEAAAKRTGMKRTPEQRARMSEAQRMFFDSLNDEQKKKRAEKIAASNREKRLGKKQSPELIAKRAAAMMGHKVSEETRAKISSTNSGRALSPEHREKLKASWAATKDKRIQAMLSAHANCPPRKHSPETRAKMSAAQRGRIRSAAHRLNLSIANKGRKLSPESIAKRTETRSRNGNYGLKKIELRQIA